MMKILFYPFYENPYQQLLIDGIVNIGLDSKVSKFQPSGKNPVSFFISLVRLRYQGFQILHLHWPEFSVLRKKPFSMTLSFINSLLLLVLIRITGFKLVWTVHNVVPHERQTVDDTLVTKFICILANALILHSKSTKSELVKLGANVKKASIIPLGNYNDVYENSISKPSARKMLGLSSKQLVFLYFGLIRPYKNIEKLIEVFNNISQFHPEIRLLIVGSEYNPSYVKKLEMLSNTAKIRFETRYLEDSEIQIYFNACDAVVLPFSKLTTSSSALVAFAFKKALIAPRLGNIKEFPNNSGFYFNNDNQEGLYTEMLSAIRDKKKLRRMGELGYMFATEYTWNSAASKTVDLYKSLF